jgi:hypothetical protein
VSKPEHFAGEIIVLRTITVVALLVSLPSVAIPCINATLLRGDKASKRVKLAETLLEQGKHEQAARTVEPERYEFEDQALARRAEIIYMVSTLRGNSYRAEHAFKVLQNLLRDTPDGRRSVFAPVQDGTPRLVAHLWARHTEEAGRPVPGIRGMPLGLPALPPEDIQLVVESWIAQGRPR